MSNCEPRRLHSTITSNRILAVFKTNPSHKSVTAHRYCVTDRHTLQMMQNFFFFCLICNLLSYTELEDVPWKFTSWNIYNTLQKSWMKWFWKIIYKAFSIFFLLPLLTESHHLSVPLTWILLWKEYNWLWLLLIWIRLELWANYIVSHDSIGPRPSILQYSTRIIINIITTTTTTESLLPPYRLNLKMFA